MLVNKVILKEKLIIIKDGFQVIMFKIFLFIVSFFFEKRKRFSSYSFNYFLKQKEENNEMTNDDQIIIRRDVLSALMIHNDIYSPRTIVLQRGKKGFGFVLRGSRGKTIFQ